MHIILAFLGVVVTLLVLINRLQENGLDLGWLNPFSWRRRRKYRLEHDLNPAFKLDSPMDVAALYMVAICKVDGELSAEQKAKILALFQSEFHLTNKEASTLLGSSIYLIGQNQEVFSQPEKVIERCYDKFSPEQAQSVIKLIDQVVDVENVNSEQQEIMLRKIKNAMLQNNDSTW